VYVFDWSNSLKQVSILSDKCKNDVTVNEVTRPSAKLVCAVVAMGDNDGRSLRITKQPRLSTIIQGVI